MTKSDKIKQLKSSLKNTKAQLKRREAKIARLEARNSQLNFPTLSYKAQMGLYIPGRQLIISCFNRNQNLCYAASRCCPSLKASAIAKHSSEILSLCNMHSSSSST